MDIDLSAGLNVLLKRPWERIIESLWFVPALIISGSVGLAIGLIELDMSLAANSLQNHWPRLFGSGADGARGLLSTIAGSMVTVAGVTFSITIVALSLASSQYSPRILRSFMRDRANQVVLGVFVGIFAYCLVVLRTLREGAQEGLFVPGLAVFGALVLAFVAIGFLMFFIHHVAESIQVTQIVSSVARETLSTVDRVFPQKDEPENHKSESAHSRNASDTRSQPSCAATDGDDGDPVTVLLLEKVYATSTGYVQIIDHNALLD